MNEADAGPDRLDMERLVRGYDGALDRLMARHADRLHAYLRRLLQHEQDAEDLAQETFVRVYQHRDRFDPRQAFATWLYAIATNLARDRYRWRSRHPEAPLDGGAEDEGTGGLAAVLPDEHETAPDAAAVAAERSTAVQQAVAALPPDLRVPLLLAEFESQSHAEIATILQCTTKAVEMRLYRARQQLRQRLARWLIDNG